MIRHRSNSESSAGLKENPDDMPDSDSGHAPWTSEASPLGTGLPRPTTRAIECVNEKAEAALGPYWAAEWDLIRNRYDEIKSVPVTTHRGRLMQRLKLARVNRAAKIVNKREKVHKEAVEAWKKEKMQEIAARSVASRRMSHRTSSMDEVVEGFINNVDPKERAKADVPWARRAKRRWTA
ncbi:hypothetical protein B0T14DRAFT_602742 [Immersiella caudata]|uniref:Uncharacterized protein n=1 Tax=Immersiella caudata TaxID=314043 RepID=A0AA39WZC5_9PEZI|nr:hypothetical protein B0T14DRAFT_602742 [Immersiella caudata]